MFVENPHAFGGVHGGATSQSDDRVGLELLHEFNAAADRRDIGIGFDFGEELIGDRVAAGHKLIDDLVEEAELDHGMVGDDEDFIDVFGRF